MVGGVGGYHVGCWWLLCWLLVVIMLVVGGYHVGYHVGSSTHKRTFPKPTDTTVQVCIPNATYFPREKTVETAGLTIELV